MIVSRLLSISVLGALAWFLQGTLRLDAALASGSQVELVCRCVLLFLSGAAVEIALRAGKRKSPIFLEDLAAVALEYGALGLASGVAIAVFRASWNVAVRPWFGLMAAFTVLSIS